MLRCPCSPRARCARSVAQKCCEAEFFHTGVLREITVVEVRESRCTGRGVAVVNESEEAGTD